MRGGAFCGGGKWAVRKKLRDLLIFEK